MRKFQNLAFVSIALAFMLPIWGNSAIASPISITANIASNARYNEGILIVTGRMPQDVGTVECKRATVHRNGANSAMASFDSSACLPLGLQTSNPIYFVTLKYGPEQVQRLLRYPDNPQSQNNGSCAVFANFSQNQPSVGSEGNCILARPLLN